MHFRIALICYLSAGDPHPNLDKGLEQEHCELYGFDRRFTSLNYGVTTTPRDEYEITTGKKNCPEQNMLDRKGKKVRVIPRIEDLKKLAVACELETSEIFAVVSKSPLSVTYISPQSLSCRYCRCYILGLCFRCCSSSSYLLIFSPQYDLHGRTDLQCGAAALSRQLVLAV